MSGRTVDAVVIGAGVIGSSVAHALATAGRSVVVVERLGGAGQGSTSASSAIIRFNYSTHAGVATAWEAHHAWAEWEDFLGGRDEDGGLARFVRTGSLCLDAPVHDPAKVLALFDQIGVPYELWDAAEVRKRLPHLDPAQHYPPKPVASEDFWSDPVGEVGGYWTPDAGFVDDPGYAAHNLATAAARAGAEFRFRTTVTGFDTTGDRVRAVLLDDGTRIETPTVVNVAGPASARVNALAGVGAEFTIGTRPLRVEVHVVPSPAEEGTVMPMVADLDLGSYFRGTPGRDLLIGGTEPACDELHWIEDPDEFDPRPSQDEYQTQAYRVARRLPDLTVPNAARGIAAVYDVADDWIPVYDRTDLPGYYVAMGTSGNQFKNAPLVGTYLREIIEAAEAGRDTDADPVRLTLPRSGVEVDLSTFSRRRPITANSSFTVMG